MRVLPSRDIQTLFPPTYSRATSEDVLHALQDQVQIGDFRRWTKLPVTMRRGLPRERNLTARVLA
jgi:hypothetical protein